MAICGENVPLDPVQVGLLDADTVVLAAYGVPHLPEQLGATDDVVGADRGIGIAAGSSCGFHCRRPLLDFLRCFWMLALKHHLNKLGRVLNAPVRAHRIQEALAKPPGVLSCHFICNFACFASWREYYEVLPCGSGAKRPLSHCRIKAKPGQ